MLCILISSCDKYRPLADLTRERLGRLWRNHPPVFFAGLEGLTPDYLGFEGDPRDWMSVNLQAMQRLRQMGYRQVYLILDDHPPLGRCHEKFLNELLPTKANELKAAYVGLLGHGQHRGFEGKLLTGAGLGLEHTAESYRWKFSLHPGLWSVDALIDLLELRMAQYQGRDRSPWNFERHRDVPGTLPPSLLGASYRVDGHAWDAESGKFWKAPLHQLVQFGFDLALFAVRLTCGGEKREAMSARWLAPYSYYRGPYPLFWSGIMRQGTWNPDLGAYLRWSGAEGLRDELTAVRQHMKSS